MNQNNNIHYTSSMNDCFHELYSLTRPLFKQGFHSIYETVCEKTIDNNLMLFREFQEELQKVPSWNSVMIEKEYERFILSTRCEWLGDLIVANFKASAKNILSSIQSSDTQDHSIDLTIPTPQNFIHYCYIEIARQLWKKPQLFYQKLTTFEKQQNDETIDKMIEISIKQAIQKNLPFDTLLKQSEEIATDKNTTLINTGGTTTHDELQKDRDSMNESTTLYEVDNKQISNTDIIPYHEKLSQSTLSEENKSSDQDDIPIENITSVSSLYSTTPSPLTDTIIEKPVPLEQQQQPLQNSNMDEYKIEKTPSTESFVSFDSNTLFNPVKNHSSPVTSLHKSASFVAPRRDSIDESDDDETISNISDEDESYSDDESDCLTNKPDEDEPTNIYNVDNNQQYAIQSNIIEDEHIYKQNVQEPTLKIHENALTHDNYTENPQYQPQFLETTTNKNMMVQQDQQIHNQEVTHESHNIQQSNDITRNEVSHESDQIKEHHKHEDKNEEQFQIDLNKSIKEIYINDKKRKNEKKIKKILGVKMNYDTYIQQDKRKLRNYLILNQNLPKA